MFKSIVLGVTISAALITSSCRAVPFEPFRPVEEPLRTRPDPLDPSLPKELESPLPLLKPSLPPTVARRPYYKPKNQYEQAIYLESVRAIKAKLSESDSVFPPTQEELESASLSAAEKKRQELRRVGIVVSVGITALIASAAVESAN